MCEGGELKESCRVCEHVVEGCIVRQPEMFFALRFQCENFNILFFLA